MLGLYPVEVTFPKARLGLSSRLFKFLLLFYAMFLKKTQLVGLLSLRRRKSAQAVRDQALAAYYSRDHFSCHIKSNLRLELRNDD